MDESLRRAARAGNVSELYSLIREDGNILRRIDEVEFIDTPLHIAVEEGCIDFAMEIMSLKPSFARKLNPDGLSLLHLAVKKGHEEMVRFMEVDKDLIRVKGKKAKTPLHYVSKQGNSDGMLNKFLKAYPECIQDVTTKNQTALHIAVKHNRLGVLQVLTRMLSKKNYCREVVNRKDKDGNTALHIAATNNQPQMLKLLLKCEADKHATNQVGSKALDIAQQLNHEESISILQYSCFSPRVSTLKYKLQKKILKYVNKPSSIIFDDMDSISGEDRNALLVVLGLLLTATYQATLSPPGGVWQDAYILERIDQVPFVDTPFHIAAFEGHINFVMEMMNMKPSFARKLNQDGFSPMHLALKNEQTKLVIRLLKTDKDLARVKGREGMTPFHFVTKSGNLDLLVEFLETCPDCIEDVTVNGDSALHLALKSDNIKALDVLVEWLRRNRHKNGDYWEREIVNLKDNDDNTVLHIAAKRKQYELDVFFWPKQFRCFAS
ncbi:hypothetical protein CCACVL1_25305 [Corchorus capsularis]|uniref:Uncharacterized protein n=1 Tax=Corchorus capsularis TaxID=210143 RepID=A0A1R3GLA9_COCAP|nr:hypothetical protein CCACVL1_25305 [Corchorus capsularis]